MNLKVLLVRKTRKKNPEKIGPISKKKLVLQTNEKKSRKRCVEIVTASANATENVTAIIIAKELPQLRRGSKKAFAPDCLFILCFPFSMFLSSILILYAVLYQHPCSE